MAAEFRHVEAGRALARLDLIAAEVGDLGDARPVLRSRRLIEVLDEQVGFEAAADRDPERLMLDRVLEERVGHPYALAIVYAAVAARAGLKLYPVAAGSSLLLGDRDGDRTIIVDPVPGGRPLDERLGWVCPHVVAKIVLDSVGQRYAERGDIARAIRAAELRLKLPLDPSSRTEHELQLDALRARLN
jgi:regulator of sirC expression with transglutaminase-like and TPR domain